MGLPDIKPLRRKRHDPLESTIEQKVCKYAESLGYKQWKFTSPTRASVPDRILLSPDGVVVFIEFKRKGKKPTPAQLKEHEDIAANNGLVFVADNVVVGKFIVFCFARGRRC